MIKMIGAILIFCSTTWFGYEAAKRYINRTKQIQSFRQALQTLEAEIMYGHMPLGEASQKIAEQLKEPISIHFLLFARKLVDETYTVKKAWKESLNEIWHLTALKKAEYEILAQFGENLGRHDRQTEQKQIMLTMTHLKREEDDARDMQTRYAKMYRSLGVLSGLLIIVLLL